MKVSDVITLGDKIDIKLVRQMNLEENGGQPANIYQSRVSDFLSDTKLEIGMPMHGGKMVLFQVGVECNLVFYTKNGLYSCIGKVEKRYKEGSLYLLSVDLTSNLTKFQRREFFRVDYMTEMKFYEISEETANLKTTEELYAHIMNPDLIDEKKGGVIHDISGGGVRFSSPSMVEAGNYILMSVRLTSERMDETFYLVSKIVEAQKHPDRDLYFHRAKFMFKDLKDRDKIVRFVFEEERKIRKREVG